jgi:hypothetical protein
MSFSGFPVVTTTVATIANAVNTAQFPLPAFGSLSEGAAVTILGVTYNIPPVPQFQPAPVVVHQNFKEFTKFTELPRELQTKIWKFNLEARTISIFELHSRTDGKPFKTCDNNGGQGSDEGSTRDNVGLAFRFVGAPRPTIFAVSKNVLEFASALGYFPKFQVHGSVKKVYFNHHLDSLRLNTVIHRHNLAQVPLANALVNRLELHSVRWLQTSLHAFLANTVAVCGDIHSMPGLKEVLLFGAHQIRPTSAEFVFQMWYQASEQGPIARAYIPGHPSLAVDQFQITGETLVSIVVDFQLVRELTC